MCATQRPMIKVDDMAKVMGLMLPTIWRYEYAITTVTER